MGRDDSIRPEWGLGWGRWRGAIDPYVECPDCGATQDMEEFCARAWSEWRCLGCGLVCGGPENLYPTCLECGNNTESDETEYCSVLCRYLATGDCEEPSPVLPVTQKRRERRMAKNGEEAIGRGAFTPIKQRDLEKFLRQYFQVCQFILTKNKTWARPKLFIADITAGKGIHPETGEDGSPLILLRLLEEFQMNYRACFIEQQPDNFATLQGVVAQQFLDVRGRCVFQCGDHVQLLYTLVRQFVILKTFGLIYYDFTTENFARSLEFLAKLYQDFRPNLHYVDCLLYLSATAIKRVRRAFPEHADLLTFMQQIPKKQWLVREPSGANQYTFLLGTNYVDYQTSNKIGLFPITTPRGKAILERLNYTNEEWEARQTAAIFPAL